MVGKNAGGKNFTNCTMNITCLIIITKYMENIPWFCKQCLGFILLPLCMDGLYI